MHRMGGIRAGLHFRASHSILLTCDMLSTKIVNLYILTMAGFRSLAPKTRNLVVAGGLSAFVLGVYYYTMRAVGGTDELQVAIDKFEEMKKKDAARNSNAGGS
ncbi:unnamed protein product [Miscanthus lutarioriparius]|uniref:Cytochrome c oxidase assembly factor 3 mitochondrial coiled-coil domain-containing protein n=2 Tax=Miscanthus lutarioriparius TaxID=422564 RepID=A0A811RND8_9POAL|nr:unnamed protein product [Miscanthus lutarioriparius]